MLGVRLASALLKTSTQLPRISFVPKCHFSLLNMETTSLIQRTSSLPSNLIIKNIIEMLEKIKDETEKARQIDITSLSLIKSVLKITHIKNGTQQDLCREQC